MSPGSGTCRPAWRPSIAIPEYRAHLAKQFVRIVIRVSCTRATEFPAGDYRRLHPRFQDTNFDANLRLLEKLEGVASRARATPGQVALAWLLAQGPDIVPIFGTTRRTRLRENLEAVRVQLASCDQFLLDQVFAPGNVAGERYLPAGMATLDRDP